MTIQEAIGLLQNLVWTSFILVSPLLATAMAVGLVISLIQTVTSIQEQTLVFVPKLIASGIVLVVISQWMLRGIMDFSIAMFQRIADMGV